MGSVWGVGCARASTNASDSGVMRYWCEVAGAPDCSQPTDVSTAGVQGAVAIVHRDLPAAPGLPTCFFVSSVVCPRE